MNGCKTCGKRGGYRRYCDCGNCCCDHIGFLCPDERNADTWKHYWRMMDSDLIVKPHKRPSKPSKSNLLTPCNNGHYHGKLRAEWKL